MLGWPKGGSADKSPAIRDTLFGDMPMSQWLAVPSQTLPVSFKRAKETLDGGDRHGAIEVLQNVTAHPSLESRHHLQAWHFLRELGVRVPPERAKDVLGVVVEVGVEGGLDLVAAYSDNRARYYNYSGAGVVWERPNDSLDGPIGELLQRGRVLAQAIGPWKQPRPPAPPKGEARINLLTPSGLFFGHGPIDLIGKDPLGGPTFAAAFRLMQALIGLTKKTRQK